MRNMQKSRGKLIKLIIAGLFVLGVILALVFYKGEYINSFWSLMPPVIAIVLALLTKEVYTSLFVGIVFGCFLYVGGFSFANIIPAFEMVFFGADIDGAMTGGIVPQLADSWNIGILLFLVILGIIVSMINRAGGSSAFGKWAGNKIKGRAGAQLATVALGCLIFIDDYFNCLTVGSVMRPVTDKHNISRAKLAYIIDATAAPVCIIAPISSWAAAVSSYAPEGEGLSLFIRTIPYNYYALLTIVMMVVIVLIKLDFGPMKTHEINAEKGDLFTTPDRPYGEADKSEIDVGRARVLDLILPIIVLIVTCVAGMVYTGGFFSGESFVDAFSNSDASMGLVYGSFISIVFVMIYFLARRLISFKELTDCIPEGFKAMVPAILILVFAWGLAGTTRYTLGSSVFVENAMANAGAMIQGFVPGIMFLIAVGISFSTGTSWGTFGILIPISIALFPNNETLMIVTMSACLAGSVCGDHCSPISDTTIMASAGAHSNHLNHVSTQLPYAMLVAAISCVTYVITGLLQLSAWIGLPIGIVLMVGSLLVIKSIQKSKDLKRKIEPAA